MVLVRFPFTSLEVTKKRPALVLATTPLAQALELVTLAMITSQVDGLKLPGDVRLKEWQSAHLLHPSLVRLAKIATLDGPLIEKVLGALHESDRKAVQKQFTRSFRPWVIT